ncbi:hypothetical protein Tco_0492356 [Tanacetum coccineum]
MGDENPIRTIGDYSKPSQRRAIEYPSELPAGINVYLFDPTPSGGAKRLAYSMDFGLVDPKSQEIWLKAFRRIQSPQGGSFLPRLILASILSNRGREAILHNDILMFQQHHGESLSKA